MTPATLVLLQAQGAPPGGDPVSFLFPMVAIFLIFYLLLIRPQQKRQREHETMLKAVEKGDDVVTSGGLHGRVTGTTDDVLTLEIATSRGGEKIRVKVDRSRLDRVEKGKEGDAS